MPTTQRSGTRPEPQATDLATPGGRMALTNYLSATALLLAGGALLAIDSRHDALRSSG